MIIYVCQTLSSISCLHVATLTLLCGFVCQIVQVDCGFVFQIIQVETYYSRTEVTTLEYNNGKNCFNLNCGTFISKTP